MEDLKALQRQYKLLSSLREELEGCLDRLISDLGDEIDAQTGERAYSVTDIPGMTPLCYGLKWSLKDEPWTAIAKAEQVIDVMKELRTDISAEPRYDALAEIPQDVWEGYMRLARECHALRERWYAALEQEKAYWDERVMPYLRNGEE